MNKKFIVRKNEEIQEIIKKSNKKYNKFFVLYFAKNSLGYNRFCISVGKKIGKAHTRNLYKRRVKDILMKNVINSSNDYVIILRTDILGNSYQKISDELLKLLRGEK